MMNAPIFAAPVAVGAGENEREEMSSADGGTWGLTKKKGKARRENDGIQSKHVTWQEG